jgi:hypothetical protein
METKQVCWQPLQSLELRREIEGVVRAVAERIKMAPLQDEIDLANGLAGRCLLYALMDRLYPDEGWDMVGHQCLVAIQGHLNNKGTAGLSLFTGLSGILMAVKTLSRGGTRYGKMMDSMLQGMVNVLPGQLHHLHGKMIDHLEMPDFDTISGVTGIGRTLLAFADRAEVRALLEDVLLYLVELSGEKEVFGQQVAAWHVSSQNQFQEKDKSVYPQGNFNLGLAHGIAGPLALLSLAMRQGIEVQGQREAIRTNVQHLLKWVREDQNGPVWTGRVSFEEWVAGEINVGVTKLTLRDSWCYGAPGIARAVWLAGDVLGERSWQQLAEDSFRGIAGRTDNRFLTSPIICHGWGGVLQFVQRMHADTGLEELDVLREELVRILLDSYSEEYPFGFADTFTEEGVDMVDHRLGLLEGAIGPALALLGVLTDEQTDWDAVLLIS